MSQLVVLIASFYFKAHPRHYAIKASPANNTIIVLLVGEAFMAIQRGLQCVMCGPAPCDGGTTTLIVKR